jgi:phospholipase/carboxylesterase
LDGVAAQLIAAAEPALSALDNFCAVSSPEEAIPRVLYAMRKHCDAQRRLYPLTSVMPPVSAFFTEPAARARAAEPPPAQRDGVTVGLIAVRDRSGARGGFAMYVPERYDPARAWPLVIALHGGSGIGDDFLWTWVTEARSRGFMVMAPTSLGSTWSMMGDDIDAPALQHLFNYVCEHWNVDRTRVLLTGLSDGATYALLVGLQPDMPFTALAPVSGVLHPFNFENGNMERARGKRIYLVHGALDWMFPIATARFAYQELERAGADIVFREIADLSHTYPRDENDRILTWFDPALALAS